jgi:hypothetical protein
MFRIEIQRVGVSHNHGAEHYNIVARERLEQLGCETYIITWMSEAMTRDGR